MQRVVLDANVLYPAPLRDSLMHLTLTRAFQAHWTNQIHDEWTRNLKRVRPEITNAQLQRIRDLMNHHARDALVTGFEKRIRGLTLPDPDDRHVLAAAIHVSATHIVTFNLKDFPKSNLEPHGIRAIHPDAFLLEVLRSYPANTVLAVTRQWQSMKSPAVSLPELLVIFERQGLAKFAQQLRLDMVALIGPQVE